MDINKPKIKQLVNETEARALLAMSRVMAPISDESAARYLASAKDIASRMGANAFDGECSHEPFDGEPVLAEAWQAGLYYEGMRQSADFAMMD